MDQNKDLADLLKIFTGRYFEFKAFIHDRCKDENEALTWEERLDQMIDLSRVVGIFSPETQEEALNNYKTVQKQIKKDIEENDPFL